MKPKISLIAVISENRVMARKGGIPWDIPADQKRYRRLIKNHIAILGRKTVDDSYTKTENIVITTQPDYVPPVKAHVVHSIEEAFEKAEEILRSAQARRDDSLKKDEVFVLGGGEVFKETIKHADKLYLTVVHEKTDGDTYFPDYSQFKKIVYDKKEESDGYSYEFLDLER